MDTWLIVLITIATILILSIIVIVVLWYIALPKFLIKKIRNGDTVIDNPTNFDKILAETTIEKDSVYSYDLPNSSYDVYSNKNKIHKGTIIWVHGGFFIAGSKNGVSNVATCLASEGYTVIAIDYGLAPECKYPTQLKQLDTAINHIINNRVDIDTTQIMLAGDSAGGQIVSQYVTLVNNPILQKEVNITPSIHSNRIKAMILVSSPIDVSLLFGHIKKLDILLPTFGRVFYGKGKWFKHPSYKSCHTYNYLTKTMPPTFLTDGNNISFEVQNRKLGELLRCLNVPVTELYFNKEEYGDVNHEYLFSLSQDYSQQGLNFLVEFLNNLN